MGMMEMFPALLVLCMASTLIVRPSFTADTDEKSKPNEPENGMPIADERAGEVETSSSSVLQNQVMSNQVMVNGGCTYINGLITDGNETRNATDEENAAVQKWNQEMNQWGSKFQRSMQQQMASIFPAGFPFNQGQGAGAQQRAAGGGYYQPPVAPAFPCLCKSCQNAGGDGVAGEGN